MMDSADSSPSYPSGISSVHLTMKSSLSLISSRSCAIVFCASSREPSRSGMFLPPVDAVPLYVLDRLGDLVMFSVLFDGEFAHTDVPVVDYAESARLEQRVERSNRVHCGLVEVAV